MAKATKKSDAEEQASTEERIKEAARKVFTQKGYAATRTRDIAAEAGINLALLNYYFRSKEKLFEKIMLEKVQQLVGTIAPVLSDPATTLETKIGLVADSYIDMLSRNPDLPIFVLNEIRNNAARFSEQLQAAKLIRNASFIQQLKERRPDINPLHFLVNMLGMLIFPFIGRPVLQTAGMDERQFRVMTEERKKLIPLWMKAILKAR